MPAIPRRPLDWSARRRRSVGSLLLGAGALLVVLTALAGTGILPLWRPSVPPPPALVEAHATRVALGSPAPGARATHPPSAALAPDAATPTPAPLASPMTVVGALPERTPVVQRPPRPPDTRAEDEPHSDELAAPPALVAPLPTFDLPPLPTPPPQPTLVTSPLPSSTPRPTPVPPLPLPGLPVHLVIPRIRVDTTVVELSTTLDAHGVPQWETVPFVAGHYRVTGLVGARTNVVLSGHVVTRDMGNVFRDLHLLRPGDPVVVYTEQGQFTYRVSALRLVDPSDTSVLAPSGTPQLSLITCAGAFDFRTHTFNQRLVVVGDLVTS
jgi:LPXTG-site transpeptidase (sortase) family protein